MAKKTKLVEARDRSSKYKHAALIHIHARATQISNEILVLFKAGYADGANARWRSIQELAVIALSLYQSDNDIARRYLDHHIMKEYRDTKEYQTYCKNLGYAPFSVKEMRAIENKYNKLKDCMDQNLEKQDN